MGHQKGVERPRRLRRGELPRSLSEDSFLETKYRFGNSLPYSTLDCDVE